jgi:hypothetical protein
MKFKKVFISQKLYRLWYIYPNGKLHYMGVFTK